MKYLILDNKAMFTLTDDIGIFSGNISRCPGCDLKYTSGPVCDYFKERVRGVLAKSGVKLSAVKGSCEECMEELIANRALLKEIVDIK